tara:strand:- start:127054 stop:127497 length:444 start_codon:yes stop_codon:yes gene_type:complete
MLVEILKELLNRDLNKLKLEIESYQNETLIWAVDKNITNCAGNLCLHIVGNLNTYIGAVIGKTGYVRNRDAEFSLKNVSRTELLGQIDNVISVINRSLVNLTQEDLDKEYPLQVFKEKTTTSYFLIHLTTHLAYHLGQVNYHRRLLD